MKKKQNKSVTFEVSRYLLHNYNYINLGKINQNNNLIIVNIGLTNNIINFEVKILLTFSLLI